MIIVLNFGGQYAHLIARRIRGLGVKAEIFPFAVTVSRIRELAPKGIVLSGGPASVNDPGSPTIPLHLLGLGIPVLGICYGHQLIAKLLGGKVEGSSAREYGKETFVPSLNDDNPLFAGLWKLEIVWFSHGDTVTLLPPSCISIGRTAATQIAAMRHHALPIYGVQFHPEVSHTEHGTNILANFVFRICKAERNWDIGQQMKGIIEELRERIGTAHVLIGVSGGVDSLVAATLLHRAVGDQLHAVFVDTGLLREGEAESIPALLKTQGFAVHVISCGAMFLNRLHGVQDPEHKRLIIGYTFAEAFEQYVRRELHAYPIRYVAQGTIYPDRIESAGIKSHHNQTLPEDFGFEIVEPIAEFYKDEVRLLGKQLGIAYGLLWQHPFPGPGFAIRIVGVVTPSRLKMVRAADKIYMEELKRSGEYEKIWQAFAVLLPFRTVGVMGDQRTYEYMVSLRAVDSVDGMTVDWHRMPPDLIERISNRIVREVRGVNRVLYDVTAKPPATIEYE